MERIGLEGGAKAPRGLKVPMDCGWSNPFADNSKVP